MIGSPWACKEAHGGRRSIEAPVLPGNWRLNRLRKADYMSHALHRRTPSLLGSCPRGLPILTFAYHRVTPVDEATARVERRAFDALGRLTDQWDARLWA